jgi:hypothetical protein
MVLSRVLRARKGKRMAFSSVPQLRSPLGVTFLDATGLRRWLALALLRKTISQEGHRTAFVSFWELSKAIQQPSAWGYPAKRGLTAIDACCVASKATSTSIPSGPSTRDCFRWRAPQVGVDPRECAMSLAIPTRAACS